MRTQAICKVLIACSCAISASRCFATGGEEFVGPFASWRDLKRDYGAVGDGRADDTAAIQRALDDLVKHQKSCVLYIPHGVYRLTATVRTVRKAHTDCQGVSVIGEDPATTVLHWDGPDKGTMFQWDAWYSRISRLTLNGAKRAGICLLYGPAFSTYNETSDLWFRDAASGLVFGEPNSQGQAENEVLRCRFERCGTGVQTVNWNSMDIWCWYCRFEDCGRGVHNVMGNWHVWNSLFLRSSVADMSTQNLMVFSVANNVSKGSRCFFDFSTGHTWGSPVSLTNNRVLDCTGDFAVKLDNAGPYLVVDNVFRLAGPTRAIRMTWADQTLAGNTYTRPDAVEERGRFRRLAEKVVDVKTIPDALPELPPAPPIAHRKVFEIGAGSTDEAIQRAVDQAAKLNGQRPMVHIPVGSYTIAKTIVVPAGSDLQLVGDGAGETATRLNWSGPDGGLVLRLTGPSHATLRDFYVHAPNGRALVVENADQPGGRIFADQLNASGPTDQSHGRTAAVRLRGISHANVLMRALQGSGNGGSWVAVSGSGATPAGQVSLFTGATGSAAGQYEVTGGASLVVRGVYHERSSDSVNGLRLEGSGTLSVDATRFSYATSEKAPTVAAENFHGLFTLAASMLLPVETKETCRIESRGDGSGASLLVLDDQFWVNAPGTTADTVWRNGSHPRARGGLIGCNVNTNNKEAAPKGFEFLANIGDSPDPARSRSGSGPLDNRGTVDDQTILRHLAPMRRAQVWQPTAAPRPGITDVRIHRVMASGGRDAVIEFAGSR